MFLDGNGNKIGKEYTSAAPISECQPIVKDSKVVYYASNGNMVNFYSINAQTGSASKKAYRVAGENATWKYSNGVLTISGSGEVSVPEESYRSPLSTTSYGSVYNTSKWKSLQDKVKKIVIKKGITGIADECFASFSSLTEVEIESGLKRIGEKAFYNCRNLKKITIPSSVTSIGDDILWTGSYWLGDQSHVVYAAIHTEYNSQAAKYAKRNGITYYLTLDNAKISGVRSSYTFAGKAVEPSTLKVKIGSRTLKKGTEYKVSYSNNTKPGTATLKVTGTGRFEGTLSVKFKITSPAVGTKLTDSKTKSVYTVTKKGSTVAYTSAKKRKKHFPDYSVQDQAEGRHLQGNRHLRQRAEKQQAAEKCNHRRKRHQHRSRRLQRLHRPAKGTDRKRRQIHRHQGLLRMQEADFRNPWKKCDFHRDLRFRQLHVPYEDYPSVKGGEDRQPGVLQLLQAYLHHHKDGEADFRHG